MMKSRCVAKFKLLLLSNSAFACMQPSCVPCLIKPQNDYRKMGRMPQMKSIETVWIQQNRFDIAIHRVILNVRDIVDVGGKPLHHECNLSRFVREAVTGCLGDALCPTSVWICDCVILCLDLCGIASKYMSGGPEWAEVRYERVASLGGDPEPSFPLISGANYWGKTPGEKEKPSLHLEIQKQKSQSRSHMSPEGTVEFWLAPSRNLSRNLKQLLLTSGPSGTLIFLFIKWHSSPNRFLFLTGLLPLRDAWGSQLCSLASLCNSAKTGRSWPVSEQRGGTLASQEVQQLCLYVRSPNSALCASLPFTNLSPGRKTFN